MKNINRVPSKQWNKWSDQAKHVFNEVFGFMMKNQFTMLHPASNPPKPDHYHTICWNSAWIAASAVDDSMPDTIQTISQAA